VVRAPALRVLPGISLTTEEKAQKNLSQGKKNLSQVKKNLSQVKKNLNYSTVYILPKTPTHYKALTNTHITKPTHTHTYKTV
jgi:C4-dicarboxylate-specific signal transduction histidine kinase